MVALTGIHENVMLSNLSSIGTKGAIESVRILFVCFLRRVNLEKVERLSFPRDKVNCL